MKLWIAVCRLLGSVGDRLRGQQHLKQGGMSEETRPHSEPRDCPSPHEADRAYRGTLDRSNYSASTAFFPSLEDICG
jgi:hypothetical protein